MSTITPEQEKKIAEFVKNHTLAAGMGNESSTCSLGAINLALHKKLTDDIPQEMSEVIGFWVMRTQDVMSKRLRNSKKWKSLLPLAAGTGRDKDKEEKRFKIIEDSCWNCLKHYQPLADEKGFGNVWSTMLNNRNYESTKEAYKALYNRLDDECKIIYVLWNATTSMLRMLRMKHNSKSVAAIAYECIFMIDKKWKDLHPAALLKKLIKA